MSSSITIFFIVFGVLQMPHSSGSVSIRELWRNSGIDRRFLPTMLKKLITRRFPTLRLDAGNWRNIVILNEHVNPSQFWLSGTIPTRPKSTSVINVYQDLYVLPIDSSQHLEPMGLYKESEPYHREEGVNVLVEVDVHPSLLNYFEDDRIQKAEMKSNNVQHVAYSETDWLHTFPCKVQDPYECYNSKQFYHSLGSA